MFFTMLAGQCDRITEIWVSRTLGEVEVSDPGYRRQKFLDSARRRKKRRRDPDRTRATGEYRLRVKGVKTDWGQTGCSLQGERAGMVTRLVASFRLSPVYPGLSRHPAQQNYFGISNAHVGRRI
jgi:hypothetical protein